MLANVKNLCEKVAESGMVVVVGMWVETQSSSLDSAGRMTKANLKSGKSGSRKDALEYGRAIRLDDRFAVFEPRVAVA